jgi:prepilin-type N-terminal cleavage/methylation domain-containing protein
MNTRRPHPCAPRRRGLTLVELMVTLMIISLVATAATSLMTSSANAQRYVLANTNAVSQTELAFRRVIENIRSSSQAVCVSPTEVDLVTQPDTSKAGNPVYNISYVLVGGQLMESDDRYGTNVLVANVSGFNAAVVQNTKPTAFLIQLVVAPPNSEPITRTAYVTSRNF